MINADQNEMLNELAPTVYWSFIVGPPPPPPPPQLIYWVGFLKNHRIGDLQFLIKMRG